MTDTKLVPEAEQIKALVAERNAYQNQCIALKQELFDLRCQLEVVTRERNDCLRAQIEGIGI